MTDQRFQGVPHHRRRPCRFRGRLAGRNARRPGRAARNASGAHHCGSQDRLARRTGLLELVSLRRQGAQRHRSVARGDAPARLSDHAHRGRQSGPGRRSAGGRPRRLRGSRHRRAHRPSADRYPPPGGRGAATRGLGQRNHRHRASHLAARSPTRSPNARARTRSPSSMPSRRSFTATSSICRSPGCSRATTRRGRADRAPTTSIVRSRASNTTSSSSACSRATRLPSTIGRRPISTAAFRSR